MRTLLACSVLVLLPLLSVGAQETAPEPKPDPAETNRKVLALFGALDLPSVVGRKWVRYNTGGWSCTSDASGRADYSQLEFRYAVGWVLSESEEEIRLLENNAQVCTYRRDREAPEGWEKHRASHPADLPLPNRTIELPFRAFCLRFLEPPDREDDLRDIFLEGDRAGFSRGVLAALYAFWARSLGWSDVAGALMECSRKTLEELDRRRAWREMPAVPPEGMVAHELAVNLRWQALCDAHAGAGTARLLERWQLIARVFPSSEFSSEAAEMVRLYREMSAEEASRGDPGPEAVKALAPPARAEYWMHRLRDEAASQNSDPGTCHLFFGPDGDPAGELAALGWAALPLVIERLDDPRPTRSLAWWRSFAPDSFNLLRVGDCCAQVFEEITGEALPGLREYYYPVLHGKGRELKALGKAWWESTGRFGEEKHCERLLASGPEARRPDAARALLRMDRARHLPRVLDSLASGSFWLKRQLLPIVLPLLGKDHEDLLAAHLRDEDSEAVLLMARLLLDTCGSNRGIPEVIARLESWSAECPGTPSFFMNQAFPFLARAGHPLAVPAVCRLIAHSHLEARFSAVDFAHLFADPLVAEALVRALDDESDTEKLWGCMRGRMCDKAAVSLGILLGHFHGFDMRLPVDRRDAAIADLRSWWTANRRSLDWDDLRRKARARVPEARGGS